MAEDLRYLAAGLCTVAFLAAQAFQQVAYGYLLPAPRMPEDELGNHLRPVDRARALLVGGTILLLLVPYVTVSLRYGEVAPAVSLLGLVFGAAFVGFETAHRSLDYFLVGGKWAVRYFQASELEREQIQARYSLWGDISHAWYFPLLLAHFLASCCFLVVTASEAGKGAWYALAPVAFGLNALRLIGRLVGIFTGQKWLEALNGRLYFPAVLVINSLLALWFFYLAGPGADAGGGVVSPAR